MIAVVWIAKALEVVTRELPGILEKHGEGNEADALKELADTYQGRRTGGIPDRSAKIEAQRAAVDAKLAEREAAEREKGE